MNVKKITNEVTVNKVLPNKIVLKEPNEIVKFDEILPKKNIHCKSYKDSFFIEFTNDWQIHKKMIICNHKYFYFRGKNMDYGYITLDENMSKNGIKYEFGKRYKEKIEYSSFLKVDSTDNEKLKYIEIEIFDRFSINKAIDFKIIKEVNYLDFYKPELKNSPHAIYILAMKCKDEESLKVLCTATSEKAVDAVIGANVDSYINYLLSDPHNHVTLKKVIKKYGRNNLLDKVITGEITNISSKVEVAKIGRPQDLDVFMNDSEELFIALPIIYWQREKDLIKLQKSKNKEISSMATAELDKLKLKWRLN